MGWHFELGSDERSLFLLHVLLFELIHLSGASGADRPLTSYRVSHSQGSQAWSQDDNIARGACSMGHFLKSMLKLVEFYFCHVRIVKAKHRVSQYSRDRGTDFCLDGRRGGVILQKGMSAGTIYGHLLVSHHVFYVHRLYIFLSCAKYVPAFSGPKNSHRIFSSSPKFKVHEHMIRSGWK